MAQDFIVTILAISEGHGESGLLEPTLLDNAISVNILCAGFFFKLLQQNVHCNR